METDQVVVVVRFLYARSKRGEPVMVLPVALGSIYHGDKVFLIIEQAVKGMDLMGSEYHHCQSMPSLDPRDYRLCTKGQIITQLSGFEEAPLIRPGKGPYPFGREVELLYVGDFGEFQRGQCLELGGPTSLEIALSAWRRGTSLLEKEIA